MCVARVFFAVDARRRCTHTHVAALRFVATGFRAGRSPDQDDFLQ